MEKYKINPKFSSKTKNISHIEKIVDKILEDNKEKLDLLEVKYNENNEKIKNNDKNSLEQLDVNDFSPEALNRDSIYFIRKKITDEKSENNSKKDEKPEKKTKIKVKKHISFGKQKSIKSDNEDTKNIDSTDKKENNIFKKNKEQQIENDKEKETTPNKTSNQSIERISKDEAEWLDERIKKTPIKKDEGAVSGFLKKETMDIIEKSSFSEKENKIYYTKKSDSKKQPSSEKSAEKTSDLINEAVKNEPDKESKTISKETSSPPKTEKQKTKTTKSDKKKTREEKKPKIKIKKRLGFRKVKKYLSDESALSEKDASYTLLDHKKTESEKIEQEKQPSMSDIFSTETSSILDKAKMTIGQAGEEIDYSEMALLLKAAALKSLGFSEEKWDELAFYPLQEPFAYVEIICDTDSLDKRYILIEPELTEEEQNVLDFVKKTLHLFTMETLDLESEGVEPYLKEKIDQVVKEYEVKLSQSSHDKVVYHLEKQYLGLDKIDALMKDPNIEDISCDGANVPIFLYHREYGSLKSNIEYIEEEELSAFVIRLAQKCGKHISIAEPMLDATMPDGSRIQMTLSTEVTAKGSTFTIRKFKEDPFSPPDLVEFNTMSSEMVSYMWMAVENGVNALIAGGTAAGKTSTLNALSLFIPRESKIVSIEETREINLPHPNWIPGVSRSGFGEVVADKVVGEIDMYDLMKAALRQRPEYILVGEIRGREAYVLFQAMATGHTTYSTAHADSAQSLIHRLEGKPINIPRIMLQALDIVCIQVTTRVKNKRARRCKQIIEIVDIDPTTKEILTNEVFRWDPIDDSFSYSGKSYVLENIRSDKDLSRDEITEELKNRSRLIEWMNTNNIRDFREVATILAQYAENPSQILKKIKDN